MRKMFIVVAALVITFASFSSADAAGRRGGWSSSGSKTRSFRVWRGGVFDRMLEMERRKNEIFFGGFRR